MSQNKQQRVTKCRNRASDATLQNYANNKRLAGQFNDVIVLADSESIPANRLVLACFSKFFESMFLSPMKEQYRNQVEIRQFDGKIVRSIIDFMYSGKIDIHNENALDLLAAADFLQMEDVKKFCFEFLESNVTIDNCLEILKLCTLYHCTSNLNTTNKFISENFQQIARTEVFKSINKDAVNSLIAKLDFTKVQQSSAFNAILNWTQHDESRKAEFTQLFLQLDLQKIPFRFLKEVVSEEPLVKSNTVCLNAVLSSVFAVVMVDEFKILCVNGCSKSVFEVYSSTGDISKTYPSVPNQPKKNCLLKIENFVYCIGGIAENNVATNQVFQLDLSDPILEWRKTTPMSKARFNFGATTYKGSLIVNGDFQIELFEVQTSKWKKLTETNQSRHFHALVAADKALFAIGGFCNASLSSVERLDDLNGRWRYVQSMSKPRNDFAAVACQDLVYAIGGYSDKVEKSVEKYDPSNNKWSTVNSMNIERYGHAACVQQNKIYVIGGKTISGNPTKTIECYDTKLDQWTVVGETKQDCIDHAVVVI